MTAPLRGRSPGAPRDHDLGGGVVVDAPTLPYPGRPAGAPAGGARRERAAGGRHPRNLSGGWRRARPAAGPPPAGAGRGRGGRGTLPLRPRRRAARRCARSQLRGPRRDGARALRHRRPWSGTAGGSTSPRPAASATRRPGHCRRSSPRRSRRTCYGGTSPSTRSPSRSTACGPANCRPRRTRWRTCAPGACACCTSEASSTTPPACGVSRATAPASVSPWRSTPRNSPPRRSRRAPWQTVSGARVGAELRLALAEPDPLAALAELERLGLLAALHPRLRFESPLARRALDLLPADGPWAGGAEVGRPDLLLLAALRAAPRAPGGRRSGWGSQT